MSPDLPYASVSLLSFSSAQSVFQNQTVSVPAPTTIEDLLSSLRPDWQSKLPKARVALNMDFVSIGTILPPGSSTIAIIPPVSGG